MIEELGDNLKLAVNNIKKIFLAKVSDINTTEIVDCDRIVLTKQALRMIEERVVKSYIDKKKKKSLND